MRKLIYTSFSPNTRTKDIYLNLEILINPKYWISQKGRESVKTIFKRKLTNSKQIYTFNYARSGMYLLFKSLNLPKDSEIIVEGFTCIAAINPILWNKLKPMYVDIDKKTYNMDLNDLQKKISKNTKAVLFQHTFGNSSGVEKVLDICKRNNLLLFEDCTNTIFGRSRNKIIGNIGDASIFSLGRDKAISGVDGGVISINNTDLLHNFSKEYETIKNPSTIWTIKELIYPLLWHLIKSTFNIKVGKLIHLVTTKLGLLTKATTREERHTILPREIPKKLPNTLAYLALEQMKDIESINKHRSEINNIYQTYFNKDNFLYENNNILLRFPVLVSNKMDLIKHLQKQNIYLGDWYDKPITPIDTEYKTIHYTSGMCPNSENLCKKIINLPNHINISAEDAHLISNIIKEYENDTN